MPNLLVNIGYGNMVMAQRSLPSFRLNPPRCAGSRKRPGERRMLIDATQGRKTRAIIITDSDHVILSAVQVETLMLRFSGGDVK